MEDYKRWEILREAEKEIERKKAEQKKEREQ